MHLRTLDIMGFKSFAERTHIKFEPGITAVVGPNGSGKSNIFDAIRWVLGEQSAKVLRGAKMEDVIFAGSEGKKPLGLAEVSLTLDNSEGLLPLAYNEVTISRRVYRSGESEYLLNKVPCRYKDILELLMDTGVGRDAYAIIGQGKIDAILSTRAEERRAIFEDAAGVTRFRARLHDATRKLEETELNLLRVQDIIIELDRQLGPLEIEAEKTRVYREHSNILRNAELKLVSGRFISRRRQLVVKHGEFDEISINLISAEGELASAEAGLEAARLEGTGLDSQISDIQRHVWELSTGIDKTEERLKANETLTKEAAAERERLQAEIQDLSSKITELDKQQSVITEQMAELESDERMTSQKLAEQDGALSENINATNDAETEIERLRSEIIELMSEASRCHNEFRGLDVERELSVRRITEISQYMDQLKTSLCEIDRKTTDVSQKKNDVAADLTELRQLAETLKGQLAVLTESRGRLEGDERKLHRELDSKVVRHKVLSDMAHTYEGYMYGVRAVLTEFRKTSPGAGVIGSVADLVAVPRSYERAMDVALGAAVQNVVTKTADIAKAAIEFLKSRKAGRVTFLPLDLIRGGRISKDETAAICRMDGVVGIAADLVEFAPEHKPVFDQLLGRTIVAQNLDSAVEVSRALRSQYRVVTLEGDVLNAGGSMTGGHDPKAGSSLLSRRRELEELEADENRLRGNLDDICRKISEADDELRLLREHLQKNGSDTEAVKEELASCEREIAYLEKEKNRLTVEEKKAQLEWNNLNDKNANILSRTESLAEIIENAEKKREELEGRMAKLHNTVKDGQAIRDHLSAAALDLRLSLATQRQRLEQLGKDRSRIQASKAEILARLTADEDRLVRNDEKIAGLKDQREEDKDFVGRGISSKIDYEEALIKLKQKKDACFAGITGLEDQAKAKSKTVIDLRNRLHQVELSVARLETELEDLKVQLASVFEVDPESLADVEPQNDERSLEKEIASERAFISNLGEVNLIAEEDYARTKERKEFLENQKNDLVGARESLQQIIAETEQTAKAKFLDTFEKIQAEFTKVFAQLFQGGTAALKLADPDDILGSGIEIHAQPPGKKLQNLSLLSGGERALAAIAVLFSVMKVRPNPFCVLDEIDAALDEVNVARFAELLEECARDSQIIIVTHRKGTMRYADCLYGVTMEDNGISKVLSLNLQEASA